METAGLSSKVIWVCLMFLVAVWGYSKRCANKYTYVVFVVTVLLVAWLPEAVPSALMNSIESCRRHIHLFPCLSISSQVTSEKHLFEFSHMYDRWALVVPKNLMSQGKGWWSMGCKVVWLRRYSVSSVMVGHVIYHIASIEPCVTTSTNLQFWLSAYMITPL